MKAILGFVSVDFRGYKLYKCAFFFLVYQDIFVLVAYVVRVQENAAFSG